MIVIRKSDTGDSNSNSVRTQDSGTLGELARELPTSHFSSHLQGSAPVSARPVPNAPTSPRRSTSPRPPTSPRPDAGKIPVLELNFAAQPEIQKASSFSSVDSLGASKASRNAGVRVVIGHVGDCRAVLSESGQAVELTTDHHPCMPSEKARVEAAGGVIRGGRVNGVLAVTRSIGDIMYKQFDMNAPVPDAPLDESKPGGIWAKSQHVISKPDVVDFLVQPSHEFIVLASDGKYICCVLLNIFRTDYMIICIA
jgi:hypothetical protein